MVRTIICPECLESFCYQPMILFGSEVFTPAECPLCLAEGHHRRQRDEQQREIERRLAAWELICPSAYRETEIDRIPENVRDFAKTWISADGKGIGFVGPTGNCKTRTAYLILGRYHFDGLRVKPMTATRFGQLVLEKFSDDQRMRGNAVEELRDLMTAKIVLLDDVGKERLTERVASELFGLIETRTAWKRPIVWTTNLVDPGVLRRALGDDKGDPLIRRLREFTQIVKV